MRKVWILWDTMERLKDIKPDGENVFCLMYKWWTEPPWHAGYMIPCDEPLMNPECVADTAAEALYLLAQ